MALEETSRAAKRLAGLCQGAAQPMEAIAFKDLWAKCGR